MKKFQDYRREGGQGVGKARGETLRGAKLESGSRILETYIAACHLMPQEFQEQGISYVNTMGAARNQREQQGLLSAMTSRPTF